MRSVPAPLSPFGDEPLAEVPLPDAPLVRVVSQVRFPQLASIEKREFVGDFQEVLRSDYPILREEHGVAMVFGPGGISEQTGERIWRFHNTDGTWRVSLAPTFVALETDKYVSRDDFFTRFQIVVDATAETVAPSLWERLGVRYVDRLDHPEHLDRLPDLVRPDVLGLAADHTSDDRLQTFVGHGQFALADDRLLLARTAILPAGALLDPSIPPAEARSWTLDLDMANIGQFDFDPDDLVARGRDLAAGVYRYFRWSVTTEFLRTFGASADDLRKLEEEEQ
jgi:uncharacterized protein (TIGR04255 family)